MTAAVMHYHYPPHPNQLRELVRRGRVSHWPAPNAFELTVSGANSEEPLWQKGQSGGFGPPGAFSMKNPG
jgi:hypothetical protein